MILGFFAVVRVGHVDAEITVERTTDNGTERDTLVGGSKEDVKQDRLAVGPAEEEDRERIVENIQSKSRLRCWVSQTSIESANWC